MKCARFFPLCLVFLTGRLLGAGELKPFQCAGTMPLTLEQAVDIALKQNPLVLNAKQEIQKARGQYIEIRAQALPHVVLTANYQQQARDLVQGQSGGMAGSQAAAAAAAAATPKKTPVPTPTPTPAPGVSPTPTPIPTPTPKASASPSPSLFIQNKTWQVTIQASQLLYSGGQVSAGIRMGKLSQDSACFRLQDAIQTVIANVRTQFYEVLVNRELIAVQEEQVALLASQLKDQQARFEVGSVPRFNVLQAEVALANARPPLTQARNNYHIAQLQLAKTLGYETRCLAARQEPFQLFGELCIPDPYTSLSCGLWIARERNPFLQAQRLSILMEIEDVLIQRAGYKPTLSANSGYTIENNRLSRDLGDIVHGWFFAFQGSWAIFDGGETYGKVKQAKARLEQARINYEDTMQQVELQVQQAWANLLQARETIGGGRATIVQAAEAVRLARERLAAGAGTQLDILNATVQLAQARTTELQARSTYNAALAEFDRVTAACLPPPDPLLARPLGSCR